MKIRKSTRDYLTLRIMVCTILTLGLYLGYLIIKDHNQQFNDTLSFETSTIDKKLLNRYLGIDL